MKYKIDDIVVEVSSDGNRADFSIGEDKYHKTFDEHVYIPRGTKRKKLLASAQATILKIRGVDPMKLNKNQWMKYHRKYRPIKL